MIAEGDLPFALSRLGGSDDNVDGSLGKGPGYVCTQVLAYGTKRTNCCRAVMSATDPKRTSLPRLAEGGPELGSCGLSHDPP